MEHEPSKSEHPLPSQTMDAYRDFERDVLNVLHYASPEMPQEVKDKIALKLSEIEDVTVRSPHEFGYESILPEKRFKITRAALAKNLRDWMDTEDLLERPGSQEFLNSIEKH